MTRRALKVKLETPKSLRCGLERVKDLYYTPYTAGCKIGAGWWQSKSARGRIIILLIYVYGTQVYYVYTFIYIAYNIRTLAGQLHCSLYKRNTITNIYGVYIILNACFAVIVLR